MYTPILNNEHVTISVSEDGEILIENKNEKYPHLNSSLRVIVAPVGMFISSKDSIITPGISPYGEPGLSVLRHESM